MLMSEFYAAELSKEMIEMYALTLAEFSAEQLMQAFTLCARDPSIDRMPKPAVIISKLQPVLNPRQAAISLIDAIKAAVVKFGWPQGDKARAELGESNWAVIERLGGWQKVCEDPDLHFDNPTVYAQTRDKIEAQTHAARIGVDYDRPQISGTSALKLLPNMKSIDDVLRIEKKEEE